MPNLLGRHYRMLSAAFSVIGKPRSERQVSVFFGPANRQSFALPRAAQSRSASVSNSLRNLQQIVASSAFIRKSQFRRVSVRSSHSS
jgi:hypothetical protein